MSENKQQNKTKKAAPRKDRNSDQMKRMGSPTGAYDPFSSDWWRWTLYFSDKPTDVLVAMVVSKTVAFGHHWSAFAVDENNKELTLRDLAKELERLRPDMSWHDQKYYERIMRNAEEEGRLRRDEYRPGGIEIARRKVYLCAIIHRVQSILQRVENKGTQGGLGLGTYSPDSPSIRLRPTRIAEQLLAMPDDTRLSTEAWLKSLDAWHNQVHAEAKNAADTLVAYVERSKLQSLGVKYFEASVNGNTKRAGRPKTDRGAQLDLLDWQLAKTPHLDLRLTAVPESLRTPRAGSAGAEAGNSSRNAHPNGISVSELPENSLYLMHSDQPTVVSNSESVLLREESVSPPQTDGPTNATHTPPASAPPLTGEAPPPPIRRGAPTPPRTRGNAGARTGLTGTPSIEARAARTERLTDIVTRIPLEMLERTAEKFSDHLLRQIEFELKGAPVIHFAIRVAKDWERRPEYFTSLGLLINLATDVGAAWLAGAADRQAAAAGAARRTASEEQRAGELAADERKRAHLIAHPEACEFCAGAGVYSSDKLPQELRPRATTQIVCGCPAGEARAKGASRAVEGGGRMNTEVEELK